ncbi:unnamed protein product [Ectocarpus sp. 12 AP-2014]
MFLTPRSVCVLVCDAEAFGQQRGSEASGQVQEDWRKLEELRVCHWLRSISRRVPYSDVILVATKCDLARGNTGDIGKRLEHACRTWVSSWVRNGMLPVRLERGVCLTSCCPAAVSENGDSSAGNRCSNRGWGCDWRSNQDDISPTSLLHRLVNKLDAGGLRGAQMVLPRSWGMALTGLEALELGRDPVEMVLQKLADPDSDTVTESAEGKTGVYQGITVEDLNAKWQAIVDGLTKGGIAVTNATNALEGALSIREFDGSLVRHETFVFLDVVWLARILKPLLNHKDEETYEGFVHLGETGDKQITLEDPRDIASWWRLKNEGVLEPRLADAMWPDGLSEYVLPTLVSLDLTFPLASDPARGLVVLLRLNLDRPERVGKVIDTFCLNQTPVFNASWKVFLGVPPGAIEKVLTRCCSLGGVQIFWRYGVLVHGGLGDQDGHGIFAAVLEYSSADNVLTAQIFGDISSSAVWVALSYVMSAVSLMLLEFPGLRWRGSLKCPQHGDTMLLTNKVTRAGDKFLEGSRCQQCSADTRGLGAAAIDLIRMVDIRLNRDMIFREVKERFVDLKGQYSFTSPAGSSKEEDLLIQKIDEVAITVRRGFDDTKAGFGQVKGEIERGVHVTKAGLVDVQDEVKGGFDDTKAGLGKVKGEIERGVDEIKAEFGDVQAEVMGGLSELKGRLGTVLENTQESLMRLKNLQTPNYLYPRLVAVEENGANGTSSGTRGKKSVLNKLRGVVKKDMTLHFLCPVDMTKVPCGYRGEGYRFRETRGWVKKMSPVLQVALVMAKVALKATSGLDVDLSDFLEDVKDGLVGELVDRTLDEDALLRVISGEEDVGADMQQDTRASYETLKKFMDKEQVDRLKNARDGDGYVDFREKMKRVADGMGGEVWVRNENVQQWTDSHAIAAP